MPRTHWLPRVPPAGAPGSPADQVRRAEFRGFLCGVLWAVLLLLAALVVRLP